MSVIQLQVSYFTNSIIWLQHGVNGTKCDCHIRSGYSDSSAHSTQLTIFTNEEGKGDVRSQESNSCIHFHNHSILKGSQFINL